MKKYQMLALEDTRHPGIEDFEVEVNFFRVSLGGIVENLGHQEVSQ